MGRTMHNDDFTRLPGLYRGWELAALLAPGVIYHLEQVEVGGDGTPLYAVFMDSGPAGNMTGGSS